MIKLNPMIASLPSNSEIEEWMDDIGYYGYIPFDFIKDLYSLWSYLIFGKSIENIVIIESDYDKAFLDLIQYFKAFTEFKLVGKEFIQQIILILKNRVSFREIELSRLRRTSFGLVESLNNKFELNDLSSNTIDTFLQNPEKSDMLLTPEILKVLNLFNGLVMLPGNLYEETSFNRMQMTHYSQVSKVIKHHLISPLFPANFARKNLPIKYSSISRTKKAKIILLIDCSTSIIDNENYDLLRKAVILYYINKFSKSLNITIYFYARYLTTRIVISDVKQLQELYWKDTETVMQVRGSDPVISQIENMYKKYNVIFINDGNDEFSLYSKFNNKWHIVTTKYNKYLKQIADNSCGTYINL